MIRAILTVITIFVVCFGALVFFNIPLNAIDSTVNQHVSPHSDKLASIIFYSFDINGAKLPLIILWLMSGAAFFTVFLKFINIRGFKHAIDLVMGKYSDSSSSGEVSHFQALATAVSGTVGLGSIAGVAIAISIGGPGATLWMIVGGLLGMSSKFAECTLGVKYRKINEDGSISGGPMYYLKQGLAKQGKAKLGTFLAFFFAVVCALSSFGGGNMFQVNQATSQLVYLTGGESSIFYNNGWIFGTLLAMVLLLLIGGGIKYVAKVTEKIVPFMCGVYLLAGLAILVLNFTAIPATLLLIIKSAFAPQAVKGGVIGAIIIGFKRSAFSSEAGVGSAPIVHSTVKTDEPVSEGFVALLEPFIASVLICTMTALIIIITGTYQTNGKMGGVELTSAAFASVLPWFPLVLGIAVILFALSTTITWLYYGQKAFTYVFGENKVTETLYQIMFCTFIILGSCMSLSSVVDFSDALFFSMAIPNMIGLYLMAPEIKRDLDSYMIRIVKAGEVNAMRARVFKDKLNDAMVEEEKQKEVAKIK